MVAVAERAVDVCADDCNTDVTTQTQVDAPCGYAHLDLDDLMMESVPDSDARVLGLMEALSAFENSSNIVQKKVRHKKGQVLNHFRAKLPDREWGQWLTLNLSAFGIKTRQSAYRFMRFAERCTPADLIDPSTDFTDLLEKYAIIHRIKTDERQQRQQNQNQGEQDQNQGNGQEGNEQSEPSDPEPPDPKRKVKRFTVDTLVKRVDAIAAKVVELEDGIDLLLDTTERAEELPDIFDTACTKLDGVRARVRGIILELKRIAQETYSNKVEQFRSPLPEVED